MQPKEKKTICEAGIVALTFNADRTQCAFSPNNHLIYIFSTGGNDNALSWVHCHTLDAHQQSVAAIDWHHGTNQLLTVGQDRQSFVWVVQPVKGSPTITRTHVHTSSASEAWVPQLVELDSTVKRGLVCAKWAAGSEGNKFYIGSAASNVAVGTFNSVNQWWYGRVISNHASTVTAIAPHPTNNTLVATGSTDGFVLFSSTYLKQVDGKGVAAEKFGAELCRVAMPGKAWVNALSWCPSGEEVAVVSHDSRLHILRSSGLAATTAEEGAASSSNVGRGFAIVSTVTLPFLPMKDVQWLSDSAIVAAGYDYFPILIENNNGKWCLKGKWTAEKPSAAGAAVQSQASLARMQFQNESRMGQKAAVELVNSRHKNTINSIYPIARSWGGSKAGGGRDTLFVTSGMDGQIEFWKADEMTPQ